MGFFKYCLHPWKRHWVRMRVDIELQTSTHVVLPALGCRFSLLHGEPWPGKIYITYIHLHACSTAWNLSISPWLSSVGSETLGVLESPFPNIFILQSIYEEEQIFSFHSIVLPCHLKEITCAQLKLHFFFIALGFPFEFHWCWLGYFSVPIYAHSFLHAAAIFFVQSPYIFKQSNVTSVFPPLSEDGRGCWNINAPFSCPLFASHFSRRDTTAWIMRLSSARSMRLLDKHTHTHTCCPLSFSERLKVWYVQTQADVWENAYANEYS